MIVLYLLIPLSIVTAGVFLLGFIWAVRSGQYEDTCTPSLRLLAEGSDTPKAGEVKRPVEADQHEDNRAMAKSLAEHPIKLKQNAQTH
jgi:cbb3-type cytochrome oxidase maturation protein